MEPKATEPFFETAAITGAASAVAASLVLYGSVLALPGVAGFWIGCVGCCGLLLSPGLVTTRLQVQRTGYSLELGRGAIIGFTTGLVFAIVFNFMDLVWGLFTINVNVLLMDTFEEFIREYGDAQTLDDFQDTRDEAAGAEGFSILNFLMSAFVIGMLNMITGMIGTAVFKGEETIEL